jgi:hypothetical protein
MEIALRDQRIRILEAIIKEYIENDPGYGIGDGYPNEIVARMREILADS